MKTRLLLIIGLYFLIIPHLHAEYFRHIGRTEGLSQPSVMAIFQDQLGRMWFGTQEGVNIYSGDNMTVYKGWIEQNSQFCKKLLIGNEVGAIVDDRNGDVFLTVDDNLLKYDIRKETFKRISSGYTRALTSYRGDIWCARNDSIFQYDPNSEQLVFRLKTYLSFINYMIIDQGQIYLGATSGLFAVKKIGGMKCIIPNVDVYRIFKSSQKEFWIAGRTQGLYRINPKGEIKKVPYDPMSPKAIASTQIREFVEDWKGNIWFGTFNGLQKYNPYTETYSLLGQEQRAGALKHSSVFSLYQDVQGTIWVGTYYGGVSYFNPDNYAFSYYPYNPDRTETLRYPFVGAMAEDKEKNLWICTDGGGLACLDSQTGHFMSYTAGPNSLPHNNLKSICYDSKRDRLYIATHLGGLSRYDRKTGQFYNYLQQLPYDQNLPNDVTFHVAFHNDRLFVSARNGLFMMNPDTNEFQCLRKGYYVQTFDFDTQGGIWLAQQRELKRLDINSAKITDSIDLAIYGCQFPIMKLTKSKSGKLYVGTQGSGLFCYDNRTKSVENYTSEKDQLLSNYCYNLLETSENNLLITSDRGITLFDPKNKSFRSIELDNGLSLSSIISGCGLYMCSNQRIFIGGTAGLVSFFEKDLDIHYSQPKLYFSALSINNVRITPDDDSRILTEALPFTREIKLKASQANLVLEFASSNYVDILNSTWYEYKLEGFDKEWLRTSQTNLKYTNLDPGTYNLRVREKDNALNTRAPQEISLIIRIATPWYFTIWAWISYILICASITFFIQRERSSRRTLAMPTFLLRKFYGDVTVCPFRYSIGVTLY